MSTVAQKRAQIGLHEAVAAVTALDLTNIMARLQEPVAIGGKGFDESMAVIAEQEYREFLALCQVYPDTPLTPTKLVDEVWHQHILDTSKYAKDCDAVFGEMLHHYPDYKASALEAAGGVSESTQNQYEQTNALYIEHFGHKLTEVAALCSRCYCDD